MVGCAEHQHDESCGSHGGLHVHEPLLGGQLIALGDHGSGYNIELLIDENNHFSVYILDAHAENFVRIDQESLQMNLSDENNTSLTLHAVADSATGETVGNTSHFQNQRNGGKFLPLNGIIEMIEIGSKQYSEIEHLPSQGNPRPRLMSIEDKRDQLTEELLPFEDHLERFAYIIDRAKDAPGLDQEYKIDTFLIKGCVSQLWIFPKFEDGNVTSKQIQMPPSPKVLLLFSVSFTVGKARRM